MACYYLRGFDSLACGLTICGDKSGRPEFYTAEIADHDYNDVGKSERIDLAKNRFAGSARWLSVVGR